jgi:hypothetical protein
MTRRELLQLSALHAGAVLLVSGTAAGAAIQNGLTESCVLEIGREVAKAKRETFHPGGDAKPGPMFEEKSTK